MADKDMIKNRVCKGLQHNYTNDKYPSGHEDTDSVDVFCVYEGIIKDRVDKFDPGKPKDGIPGYLAYNQGDKRMKTRTGRFLTKKLKLTEKLPEQVIHSIADEINGELFAEIGIRLDKGSKITDNYRHAVGSSSCMTTGEADCTKLYEANPDRFQQLVMNFVSDSARAIVAKLDNGQYLLDRVYSSSSSLRSRMHKYAAEHGWLWHDGSSNNIRLAEDGDFNDCEVIKMSGLNWVDGEVPYMDTFHRYKIVKGKLDIYHCSAIDDYDGILDSTDGYIGRDIMCHWCEEYYSEDYITRIGDESICDSCLESNFFYCSNCEEYHDNDSGTTLTTHLSYHSPGTICERCLLNYDYSDCDECGDWFNNDEIVTVDGDVNYCTKCAEQTAAVCQDCGDWFSESHEVDGKPVCDDCLDSYYKCEDCDEYFTIYQVVEKEGEYKCIDCAGLGDCKGQSKFEFDDFPGKEPPKMTIDMIKKLKLKDRYSGIIKDGYSGIITASNSYHNMLNSAWVTLEEPA